MKGIAAGPLRLSLENPDSVAVYILQGNLNGSRCMATGNYYGAQIDYTQGGKRNPNLNFLVRIFSSGVGVFHVNGWGPKSSIRPSKPGKSNFLGGISRDFAGISRNFLKSLRRKGLGSIFGPYTHTHFDCLVDVQIFSIFFSVPGRGRGRRSPRRWPGAPVFFIKSRGRGAGFPRRRRGRGKGARGNVCGQGGGA